MTDQENEIIKAIEKYIKAARSADNQILRELFANRALSLVRKLKEELCEKVG